MAGGWGSAKNKIRIGVFWDGIQISADGTKARITDPRVAIKRGVNITDTTNTLEVSGGAVVDKTYHNLNCSGSGEKRIKNVEAQWQDLSYGSTTTVNFKAELRNIEYAGGTLTVTKSVTFPARAYSVPAAPSSVSASRVNDAQASVTWSRNATTDAPYNSQQVERSSNGTSWALIATVSGTATSYTDTTIAANNRYMYRVRAQNASGFGSYGTSGYIHTTPAAPSGIKVSKTGTSVTIQWTNNAPYAGSVKVYHSLNGAAYTLLDTLAGTATSKTHSSVDTSKTHAYRITAVVGSLESSALQSQTVTLLNPPNAPTVTVNPSVGDLTVDDVEIEWTHNPTDSTAQTNASVRYRYVGNPSWTTVTNKNTADTHTITAGTLTNGQTYEVQVQTKGDHATYSAWSSSVLFKGSAAPSVTIDWPTSADVGTSTVVVQWTYSDPESTTQSAWQVNFYNAVGALIRSYSGTGPQTSFAMPDVLQNAGSYEIGVIVWDGDGLASAEATVAFDVDFPPPPTPTLTATFDEETGGTEIEVTIPALEGTLTNLATNPSFEASATTTEVRRNLFTNPRVGSAATGWNYYWTAGTFTVARVTDLSGYPGGVTTGYRAECTAGATAHGGFLVGSLGTAPVTPGTTYTASLYVKNNFSGTMRLSFDWKTSGGAAISTTSGVDVSVPANTVVRLSVTGVAPATAAYFLATAYQSASRTWGIGDTVEASCFLLESVASVLPYFDGAYSAGHPDSDLTASWTGAANASDSVLRGPALTNCGPGDGNSARIVRSAQWAESGSTSLRVIPTGLPSYNNSCAAVAGGTGSLTGSGITFVPGKTYTVQATLRMTAALSGPLDSRSRRIYVGANTGSGNALLAQSAAAPNAAGVTRLSVTFTVPLAATTCYVLLFNGASAGNGDVWWDDLVIVEGTYGGPYFDGATPDTLEYSYSWTGAADASTSTKVDVRAVPTHFDVLRNGEAIFTGAVLTDFDATPPRTNLWWDPQARGPAADGWRVGSGIVLNFLTGQSGQPEGLTTAVSLSSYPGFYGSIEIATATDSVYMLPVVAGQTYTMSAWVKVWREDSTGIVVWPYWDTNASGWEGGDSTFCPYGVWTRVSQTYTVPEGATLARMSIDTAEDPLPTLITVTGVMVEQSATVGSYFDGDTTDGDWLHSWTGAAHESTSTAIAVGASFYTVIDPIPPLNETVTYRVRTWSDLPSSAESDPVQVDTTSPSWIYLNGGEGWGTLARIKGNPAVGLTVGREKVLHKFAGRTKPVEFIGEARSRVLSLSGDVAGFGTETERGTWEPFEEIADLPAPICYRDPLGRRLFVSISDVSVKHTASSDLASVSCTLTEVDS